MANTAVFGIYADRRQVEVAIDRLRREGFRAADISVLLPQNLGNKDIGIEGATKGPEGRAAGGGTGRRGRRVGMAGRRRHARHPGIGPLIAAGPIVGALAGIGAGGAAGAIVGSLIGFGIPEYEAKRYEGRIKKGHILVSVHVDDSEWRSKAKTILEDTGAEDVSSSSEASADYAATETPVPR